MHPKVLRTLNQIYNIIYFYLIVLVCDSSRLKVRKYSKAEFQKAASSVKYSDREEALLRQSRKAKEKKQQTLEINHRPVMVTAYDEFATHMKPVITKNWDMVEESETLKQMFGGKPMMAYTKHQNLKQHLVRAELKTTH